MNKVGLIAAVANKTGMEKKECEKAVNAVLDTITDTLANGERVQLVNFGIFEVKERAAHVGRNPKTKEPMTVPASRSAHFKPGKTLKAVVHDN